MIDSIGTLRLTVPGRGGRGEGPEAAVAAARAALEAGAGPPGRGLIAGAPAAASGAGPGEHDSGPVVLVRRLSVELPIRRGASVGESAASAGGALEVAVRRGVRTLTGSDAETLTFADVAEYLAHFLEQCIRGRPVRVWYFRPLEPYLAPTLDETLARVAGAEPASWPRVLELLRGRGLLGRLWRRVGADGRRLLSGSGGSEPRILQRAEARPLFAAAWKIAAAALKPSGAAPGTGAALALGVGSGGPEPLGREAALHSYLQTGPLAPATWSSPAELGRAVAAMVDWIVEASEGTPTRARGEAALASLPWIDGVPVRAALRSPRASRKESRSGRGPSGRNGEPPKPASPAPSTRAGPGAGFAVFGVAPERMNRTRALALLDAAETLAGARRGGASAPSDPLPDLARAVEAAAAAIGSRSPAARVPDLVRLLQRPARSGRDSFPADARRVEAAARILDDAEVRRLAAALAVLAEEAGGTGLETEAVGLFLLVRPLLDLRLTALVREAGLEARGLAVLLEEVGRIASGGVAEPVVLHVFARGLSAAHPFGGGGPTRSGEPGTGQDAAGALEPERLYEQASRELVRWLRGFESSSPEFVRRRLVLRPGALFVPPRGPVELDWPPSGFDVLLDRPGYLDPLDAVPWWDGRGLRWHR